jgi:hypothetical protein
VQGLTYDDGEFDYVFVSDGLHHCSSPHGALLEMYRVARTSVLVFESRDSWLMRIATGMGVASEYELEAVVAAGRRSGGVNDTPVPNYVYRWTEREFAKTIRAYDPACRHTFLFFYGLNLPYKVARMRSQSAYVLLRAASPLLFLVTRVCRKLCNCFAMVALKPSVPEDLHPWLETTDGHVRLRPGKGC